MSKYPSRVAQLDRLQFLMIYSASTYEQSVLGYSSALYGYATAHNCSHGTGNDSGAQPYRPESFEPKWLRATVMPCPLAAMVCYCVTMSNSNNFHIYWRVKSKGSRPENASGLLSNRIT